MASEVWYATADCNGIGGHPILRLDVLNLYVRFGMHRLLAETDAIAVFQVFPSQFTQLYGNSHPELDPQLNDIQTEMSDTHGS